MTAEQRRRLQAVGEALGRAFRRFAKVCARVARELGRQFDHLGRAFAPALAKAGIVPARTSWGRAYRTAAAQRALIKQYEALERQHARPANSSHAVGLFQITSSSIHVHTQLRNAAAAVRWLGGRPVMFSGPFPTDVAAKQGRWQGY